MGGQHYTVGGSGYIFSNVKKGCLNDDNIFEVVRKI